MICGSPLPPPLPESFRADACPQCGEPAGDGDVCMVCGTALVGEGPAAGKGGADGKRRICSIGFCAAALVVLLLIAAGAAVSLLPSLGLPGIGTVTVEGGGNLILEATCQSGSVDVLYGGTRDGSQPKVIELGVVCPGSDSTLNLTRYSAPEPGTVFGPFSAAEGGESAPVLVARPEYADGRVATETISLP